MKCPFLYGTLLISAKAKNTTPIRELSVLTMEEYQMAGCKMVSIQRPHEGADVLAQGLGCLGSGNWWVVSQGGEGSVLP